MFESAWRWNQQRLTSADALYRALIVARQRAHSRGKRFAVRRLRCVARLLGLLNHNLFPRSFSPIDGGIWVQLGSRFGSARRSGLCIGLSVGMEIVGRQSVRRFRYYAVLLKTIQF